MYWLYGSCNVVNKWSMKVKFNFLAKDSANGFKAPTIEPLENYSESG